MNGGRRRVIVATIIGLAVLATGAAPAHATRNVVGDPDDSASPIDLSAASHGHRSAGDRRLVTHRVDAYAPWDVDDITRFTTIYFTFDVDGDGSADHAVWVDKRRGGLRAGASFDARIVVTRPDGDSVQVAFPKSAIARRGDDYHWSASSYFVPPRGAEPVEGCEDACTDSAPDSGGWIHHGTRRHDC